MNLFERLINKSLAPILKGFSARALTWSRLTNLARASLRSKELHQSSDKHISFYRRHLASMVEENPEGAVGSWSHEDWLKTGEMQFLYLKNSGLEPDKKFLDIGCGNLRLGWRVIEYLEVAGYTGVDISPEMLKAAEKTISKYKLADKNPQFHLIENMNLSFLSERSFDVVNAYSVFTHANDETIEKCLQEVHRVLRAGGFFDFTYNRSDKKYSHLFATQFFHPPEYFKELAGRLGFNAEDREDWTYQQTRMRLTKRDR